MWHWKQTAYNEWTLIGTEQTRYFPTYAELYHWCQANGINAVQV